MKRVILCTSTSGLDYLKTKPDNIHMLRPHIGIYGTWYRDGEGMNFRTVAQKMFQDRDLLPDTKPPSKEELLIKFSELESLGYHEVLVITSSAIILPGTYENLMQARDEFNGRMNIYVFDSRTLSYPEAHIALSASKMMQNDIRTSQILERMQVLRENDSLWFVIDELRNMIKTKRISPAAGFVAGMLKIKPVLQIGDMGSIDVINKVRKIDNALEYMCDTALETLKEKAGQLYIIHLGSDEHVQLVADILKQRGLENLPVFPTASACIANHGPYGAGIGINHHC